MTSHANNELAAGFVTPQPSHASIPQGTNIDAVSKVQAQRVLDATDGTSLTPPPSAQVSNNARTNKSHTPTPTPSGSHISTPPPTLSQESMVRPISGFAHAMTGEQIASAPADDLRLKVAELQAAYRDAQMSAAHHRLQYQMLAQESAAAIERMAVEARMVQFENEVIHEQARATITAPILPSPMQDGTIPVQKDLYQRMCRDIQQIHQLSETNRFLEAEHRMQEKLIFRQDNEIAGLTDKVLMLRDRIREHRDHQTRLRGETFGGYLASAPPSLLGTPRRPQMTSHEQPFAALLHASAMAREEVGASKPAASRLMSKKGHSRNTQSLSSLPATPNRAHKQPLQTPQANPLFRAMPSTAPVPRLSNLRPEFYSQKKPSLKRMQDDLGSDGTVSASDNEADDQDSEAETEILEPDQINESRASFSAARMLRADAGPTSQPAEHDFGPAKGSLRQGRLFGAVKKSNTSRAGEDEPPAKKPRTIQGIGLGIKGVSHR
jgi:hypothetical protein